MIYCLSCGRGIPDDSKFCTFCGTPTPVVDPKQPNLATNAPSSRQPVDVSRTHTSTKTVNEFYKDAGFWGAILVLAGFFLPFFTKDGTSLLDAVQTTASTEPAVLIWLVFPVTGLVVLLHSLVNGWPGFITTIFIILALIALVLFGYVMMKDPEKYFGAKDFSTIIQTAGMGLWATLLGTVLLLFHSRRRRVEVHNTKVIDRNL
ncbi:MAG: zinc-ribbon domain [Chitinophagaceae bacterium]|nr:zinc-ribbon domain [Chitinophagaceae bacterium]